MSLLSPLNILPDLFRRVWSPSSAQKTQAQTNLGLLPVVTTSTVNGNSNATWNDTPTNLSVTADTPIPADGWYDIELNLGLLCPTGGRVDIGSEAGSNTIQLPIGPQVHLFTRVGVQYTAGYVPTLTIQTPSGSGVNGTMNAAATSFRYIKRA